MQRLGYANYVAQGGDWGNAVSEVMALQRPPGLPGIHTNMAAMVPANISKALAYHETLPVHLTAEERKAWDQLADFYGKGLAYALEMSNRPQTLYGIADLPVGLAAWMIDHDIRSYKLIARVFDGETEGLTRDDILDNVTLYWLTNTAVSSARLYWDMTQISTGGGFFDVRGVQLPVAVSAFPDEIYQAPRSWAERAYPNLIHYNRLEKGGHFAAWNSRRSSQLSYGLHSGRCGKPNKSSLRRRSQRRLSMPHSRTAKELHMSTIKDQSRIAIETAQATKVDLKLEAVVIPVSDVDRAKSFYSSLRWRLDADFVVGEVVSSGTVHAAGLTGLDPLREGTDVGCTRRSPESLSNRLRIEAARAELVERGANVSAVFHRSGPGQPPLSGRDPAGRSYVSFASFSDPDGNTWLLQEVTSRLPGRVDLEEAKFSSPAELASALRRAAVAHGEHEKLTGAHDANWPVWYAEYMVAEQLGHELPK